MSRGNDNYLTMTNPQLIDKIIEKDTQLVEKNCCYSCGRTDEPALICEACYAMRFNERGLKEAVESLEQQLAEAKRANLRQRVEDILASIEFVVERTPMNEYHPEYLVTHLIFRFFRVNIEPGLSEDEIIKSIEQGVEA